MAVTTSNHQPPAPDEEPKQPINDPPPSIPQQAPPAETPPAHSPPPAHV